MKTVKMSWFVMRGIKRGVTVLKDTGDTYGFAFFHCQNSYGLENRSSSRLLNGACSMPLFAPGDGLLSNATLSNTICTPIMITACTSSETS